MSVSISTCEFLSPVSEGRKKMDNENLDFLIVGDLHLRGDNIFYPASKYFCEWFLNKSFNNSNTVAIFLGDILHEAKSSGLVNLLMEYFFSSSSMKFKYIYILQGNHDYSKRDDSGLKPLLLRNNIEIIDTPTEKTVCGKKCLFLPYFYEGYKGQYTSMREEYENYKSSDDYDFLFYHFDDETISYGGKTKGIDISHIVSKHRIGGHVHVYDKKRPHYTGSVKTERFDERRKKSYLRYYNLKEDCISDIEIPSFVDYCTYDCELQKIVETPENNLYQKFYYIYDIVNASSYEEGLSLLKKDHSIENDECIRKITLKDTYEKKNFISGIPKDGESVSISDYLLKFFETNKTDKGVIDIIKEATKNEFKFT